MLSRIRADGLARVLDCSDSFKNEITKSSEITEDHNLSILSEALGPETEDQTGDM